MYYMYKCKRYKREQQNKSGQTVATWDNIIMFKVL